MNVTIFGSGYVGLVTGACLADVGNKVVCIDINRERVDNLNEGIIPIYEPGLDNIIKRNIAEGRLEFTIDTKKAVEHGLYQFIAVGTPSNSNGSADLSYVLDVATAIGDHACKYCIVIDKSTVPVGTADHVRSKIAERLALRNASIEFDVVSNPEFLKEGSAIEDFMKPDRIIIGSDNPRTAELMRLLYTPFNRQSDHIIFMDVRSAELTKYAANAMLALRITFMNEIANVSERVGADIERVRLGIGSDPRIGYQFIYPGCGYGGSCFPKDVRALWNTAIEHGYEADLLQMIDVVNERQKKVLFNQLYDHFQGKLIGKVIALWGLSFKPNTDDIREAPSLTLIRLLTESGASVKAYDPQANKEVVELFSSNKLFSVCESPIECVQDADALAIVTEWRLFRSPDLSVLKTKMRSPVIFDGRNLYDPQLLKSEGFCYYSIGRKPIIL